MTIIFAALGLIFGFVLSRSGAADYDFIQGMFLLERFQLYGIIGSAVVITAPGLRLIALGFGSTGREQFMRPRAPLNGGNVVGGLLFGIGWSMAGMCPGPIFVNIGEGKVYAIAALLGALLGAGAFGAAYNRFQKVFRLPPLAVGTGEG